MIRSITDSLSSTRVLGLDISSTTIKAAEVIASKEGLILNRASSQEIGNNNVSQLLKKFVSESGFKTKQVALGVSSPQVVVQSFQFPRMPENEMARAIALEAEHTILNGHELTHVAVDWHLLNDTSENFSRGILAVIPKEILSSQIQTVKTAGLVPCIMDVKGLALWNGYWALSGSKDSSSKTVLLINAEERSTNFVIVRSPDELVLARDIEIGAASFKDNKDHWLSELHDSLVYARSKGGLRSLDVVVATGLVSKETLMSLESALELPVRLWNPLEQITCNKAGGMIPEFSQGPLFSVAIGLALRKLT